MRANAGIHPKLGLQGPVLAWQDPWAKEASDRLMRTGTGMVTPSQDPLPDPPSYLAALKELGTQFYVHHTFPDGSGQADMLQDLLQTGIEVCLGNEYGNINGPFVQGTNRYDIPDETILEAYRSGQLMGLLYDEPEHLQMNAGQYRKDGWFPHWGDTDGLGAAQSEARVAAAVTRRVNHVRDVLLKNGYDPHAVPLVSEHVFPVLFHTKARAGMTLCPKIMKESFQSLQLSTALGAAKQYGRSMWICADLWGPDIGPWFTRTSGFPGHSPAEYASALRMGYYMSPSHLFTENVDVLLSYDGSRFSQTEFGDVWEQFVKEFVPNHPLTWRHSDAAADIAVIHAEDSNYGQNARLFGNRNSASTEADSSIFAIWHLLSHGTIPSHGSCMHIPGFAFPRHELKSRVPFEQFPLKHGADFPAPQPVHPLFYPVHNALVYDETVQAEELGDPKLILAGGSRISPETLQLIRRRAEGGATVVIGTWLLPEAWQEARVFGEGLWLPVRGFLDDDAREAVSPFLGSQDVWVQRFGSNEVRMYKQDAGGFTLDFEIVSRP
ncbi:hypothetical protein ACFPES_14530 [Paenibacillus sp. GCM10023248]|uniref:hypothetical protein n=1 Tax=unclassified Paenibacillus TaxID=185978 RepID=UPI002378CB5A|nr:hypothetical protein [Paenibacillus sp. MAHUQ-63]MDD9268252.1 hypothetical protein [Paenibacillus sp. MAHUQ-63]